MTTVQTIEWHVGPPGIGKFRRSFISASARYVLLICESFFDPIDTMWNHLRCVCMYGLGSAVRIQYQDREIC